MLFQEYVIYGKTEGDNMRHIRLFRKFAMKFGIFVMFPFVLILGALLGYANKLQLKNDIAQNENLTAHTVNTIARQTELAENMCKTVVQNQRLTSFLDRSYKNALDLQYYSTTIRDFVKVTNGVSDVRLRLYFENETIPPGFGIFYTIETISKFPAFQRFYSADTEEMWMRGSLDKNSDSYTDGRECYYYFHKICVGSSIVGVIVAEVPEKVFDISDETSERVRVPMEADGYYIYNFSGKEMSAEDVEKFVTGEELAYTGRLVASRKEMPAGPFGVIVVTARSESTILNLILAGTLVLFFAVMLIGFFSYSRRMIQDINNCLDVMERVISSNFAAPDEKAMLAVERTLIRRDEIAALAGRIRYLLSEIRLLLDREVQQQTAAKEAQLLALQHQINPHFLYNTMEMFSAKMELAGLYEESGAISAFCRMLRYNMNTQDRMVMLKDEIQQVKYYLAIQKIRQIPFEINFHIPEELLSERCIRFLMEPFVENSFKYRSISEKLIIVIRAGKTDQGIEIRIGNNGETLADERVRELNERFQNASPSMETRGEHIGLNNINARLKLFYGEEYFIHVESADGYTEFSFLIRSENQ